MILSKSALFQFELFCRLEWILKMILECRICDKLFSHPVELRKHNLRKHDEFETSQDLNKTISSVQELKLRHLSFPVKKRKSIFDGVDVSAFKKRRGESPPDVTGSTSQRESSPSLSVSDLTPGTSRTGRRSWSRPPPGWRGGGQGRSRSSRWQSQAHLAGSLCSGIRENVLSCVARV